MNSLPPSQRGAGAGMLATFMNSASVLSIGVFFSLMIVGLASGLPHALARRASSRTASPDADATRISAPAAGRDACSRRSSATTRWRRCSARTCSPALPPAQAHDADRARLLPAPDLGAVPHGARLRVRLRDRRVPRRRGRLAAARRQVPPRRGRAGGRRPARLRGDRGRLDSGCARGLFRRGGRRALRRDLGSTRFDPPMVEPAVDFLAELAGDGARARARDRHRPDRAAARARAASRCTASTCRRRWSRGCARSPAATRSRSTIGDFATTRVEGAFRLAYLVFNTIINLTTQDAQVACFQNVARAPRAGRLLRDRGRRARACSDCRRARRVRPVRRQRRPARLRRVRRRRPGPDLAPLTRSSTAGARERARSRSATCGRPSST